MALELAETALKEMGSTSREAIKGMRDVAMEMAEGQRATVRQLVSPVGETCDTLTIGAAKRNPIAVDRSIREVIDADEPTKIMGEKTYNVVISELDRIKATCKVSLVDDLNRRYDATITDPVVSSVNSVYAISMASHISIMVRAKAQIRSGEIERLYISNTAS